MASISYSILMNTTSTSWQTTKLSSAVSQKNAERFTKHLKDAGYNAEIINNGKIRRVIISGFQTEESCREQITEMHKNQEYKDCWFMKLD